jgi:ppGpp synthetase/RelA/SpoT-type nucleotidyltranferase
MDFVSPSFTRGEVDRAGEYIAKRELTALSFDLEYEDSLRIVDNWRSSHSYPMQVIRNNLRNRVGKVCSDFIVAQPLKRFESLVSKLGREPGMSLSRMQDIGGCRAIVPTPLDVSNLVRLHEEAYAKNPKRGHELHRTRDYIEHPKASGYRGVHLIYKFGSRNPQWELHNDQRIEVQIRSRLQHVWATAVEIVGAFTREALKSSQGSPEWRRLFSLMGSVFAARENCPPVPQTPTGRELLEEIRCISARIRAEEFLSGCKTAAEHIEQSTVGAVAYLLVLDVDTRMVNVSGFRDITLATDKYNEMERRNQGKLNIQTVLVSVDSFNDLRSAYPNYYLDIKEFMRELREIIGQ